MKIWYFSLRKIRCFSQMTGPISLKVSNKKKTWFWTEWGRQLSDFPHKRNQRHIPLIKKWKVASGQENRNSAQINCYFVCYLISKFKINCKTVNKCFLTVFQKWFRHNHLTMIPCWNVPSIYSEAMATEHEDKRNLTENAPREKPYAKTF